jgi:hypothetical protein
MRRRRDKFGRFLPNTPPTSNYRESSKKEDYDSTSHTVKDELEVKIKLDISYIDLWGFHRTSGVKSESTDWGLDTLFNMGDREERHEEERCIPRNEQEMKKRNIHFLLENLMKKLK